MSGFASGNVAAGDEAVSAAARGGASRRGRPGVALVSKHFHGGAAEDVLAHVLFTSWLGVSLFLAAALAGERGAPGRALLSLVAAAALADCYASLGGHADQWTAIRFALFIVAAHALLALAPLAGGAPRGDFRAFNLMLFSRTALALLLTHVLVAGLAFALAAVEHLFDVKVPESRYPQLWFALLGVFNTAYVLAGIPRDWDRLEGRFPTPRALDVLARLVLLPLSALYLAILYVYSVKIIVVHEWPRGWVSAPIIVFAAVGLLTVLLLEPGRLTASRLVRSYGRGFFVALLPLVVLLFLAIARRTNEYGLTEERCILYAIAAFLAVVAPYFVLSRARNLAFIPLVLAAIALLAAVGPLSARSLSVRSQTARARVLLVGEPPPRERRARARDDVRRAQGRARALGGARVPREPRRARPRARMAPSKGRMLGLREPRGGLDGPGPRARRRAPLSAVGELPARRQDHGVVARAGRHRDERVRRRLPVPHLRRERGLRGPGRGRAALVERPHRGESRT